MTRYIEWGDENGMTHHAEFDFERCNPESFRSLWRSMPEDLKLQLAKTAPKVLGPRVTVKCKATGARVSDPVACRLFFEDDAKLIKQGYVLDDGSD